MGEITKSPYLKEGVVIILDKSKQPEEKPIASNVDMK
jgi:hypothetical protein